MNDVWILPLLSARSGSASTYVLWSFANERYSRIFRGTGSHDARSSRRAVSVYVFGVTALISAVVSVAGAVFFEWLYRKLLHKPQTIGDLSAALTGLLLSMVCPPTLPC